jgi:hypothetical protein
LEIEGKIFDDDDDDDASCGVSMGATCVEVKEKIEEGT